MKEVGVASAVLAIALSRIYNFKLSDVVILCIWNCVPAETIGCTDAGNCRTCASCCNLFEVIEAPEPV